eukprot:1575833-Alexandrium_andersonii.AAC.1
MHHRPPRCSRRTSLAGARVGAACSRPEPMLGAPRRRAYVPQARRPPWPGLGRGARSCIWDRAAAECPCWQPRVGQGGARRAGTSHEDCLAGARGAYNTLRCTLAARSVHFVNC